MYILLMTDALVKKKKKQKLKLELNTVKKEMKGFLLSEVPSTLPQGKGDVCVTFIMLEYYKISP